MSAPVAGREGGFTMAEIAITVTILAGMIASAVSILTSSSGLASESRLALRVNEELLRDLDVVANRFRGADPSSLGGFDAYGVSTAPSFRTVTGMTSTGTRILGPEQQIGWHANGASVHGVQAPGDIRLTVNGQATTILPRVPYGGFRVTQQGNTLTIQVTAYYAASDGKTGPLVGQTSVALRN